MQECCRYYESASTGLFSREGQKFELLIGYFQAFPYFHPHQVFDGFTMLVLNLKNNSILSSKFYIQALICALSVLLLHLHIEGFFSVRNLVGRHKLRKSSSKGTPEYTCLLQDSWENGGYFQELLIREQFRFLPSVATRANDFILEAKAEKMRATARMLEGDNVNEIGQAAALDIGMGCLSKLKKHMFLTTKSVGRWLVFLLLVYEVDSLESASFISF